MIRECTDLILIILDSDVLASDSDAQAIDTDILAFDSGLRITLSQVLRQSVHHPIREPKQSFNRSLINHRLSSLNFLPNESPQVHSRSARSVRYVSRKCSPKPTARPVYWRGCSVAAYAWSAAPWVAAWSLVASTWVLFRHLALLDFEVHDLNGSNVDSIQSNLSIRTNRTIANLVFLPHPGLPWRGAQVSKLQAANRSVQETLNWISPPSAYHLHVQRHFADCILPTACIYYAQQLLHQRLPSPHLIFLFYLFSNVKQNLKPNHRTLAGFSFRR